MSQKYEKNLKKLFTVIVIIALIFVFNFPFSVSKTFDALEVNPADNNYSVNREVIMTGKYNLNFFSADVFSGNISISGYEQTSNGDDMLNCNIQKHDGSWFAFYQKDSNNKILDITTFGTIFSKKFLRDIIIVCTDSYSTRIVMNCNSIDLAIEKSTQALNHEDW